MLDANRLTHLYGIASLIIGAVGVLIGLNIGADWKEIALFASGWVTSIFISIHLNSSMSFHKHASGKIIEANNSLSLSKEEFLQLKNSSEASEKELINQIKERDSEIQRLNALLEQRTMTLDFVASAKMPSFAINRALEKKEEVNND